MKSINSLPSLSYIHYKDLTYDICYSYVSTNGEELRYVPIQFKDEKMCMRAVSMSFNALCFIDDLDIYNRCMSQVINLSSPHNRFRSSIYRNILNLSQTDIFNIFNIISKHQNKLSNDEMETFQKFSKIIHGPLRIGIDSDTRRVKK